MIYINGKLLSIIIPCYNSAPFIGTTLEMLLSQGLDDCEVIVVNDGSSDATSLIAHGYSKIHPEIKVIDKLNEGVSVARNTGMNASCGKYIYFLDSDDSLKSCTLDFFKRVLHEYYGYQFFAFGYYAHRNGVLFKDYSFKKYNRMVLPSLLLKQNFLSKNLCFHICSCIYENSFLKNHDIQFTPGLKIGEDIEFLLKVVANAEYSIYNARHCFIYKIRDDSTMQGYRSYSAAQYHSFEVRRDIVLGADYQTDELKNYSNFWIENQLLSNIVYYLRSDFKDESITKNLIEDCKLLKRSIKGVNGALKNTVAIRLAKILPVKTILRIIKG